MSNLTTTPDIENSLSVMLWNFPGNTIYLHERCDITREKENIFFPIRAVEAREGVVTCFCNHKDLSVSTAHKPVWEELTLKEQLKIHEAVKQEYYQRKYGDFAFHLDEMGRDMRKAIMDMGRHNETCRFTESEAPRFYHDGAWRVVTELQFPPYEHMAIMAGWHDERCSTKGVNARMALSCLPLECQRDFFLLMCRRRAALHI